MRLCCEISILSNTEKTVLGRTERLDVKQVAWRRLMVLRVAKRSHGRKTKLVPRDMQIGLAQGSAKPLIGGGKFVS